MPDARLGTSVAEREIKVRIEVSALAGAKDVRLFRNGTLTDVWRNDVLDGKSKATLDTTVKIVAGENRLTAYAYNSDNIKSEDDVRTLIGAETLKRKGVMHVLTIGVNEYANKDFDLRFAVPDAIDFADELKRQQDRLKNFDRIEVKRLLDSNATKANIQKILTEFVGKVEPEDAVVIFFAGHGVKEKDRFYLLPHDIGYAGRRGEIDEAGFQTIFANGVSDEALEAGIEKIDAGHFLIVIDACNSGQALEAADMRPGPMNSKGLAQLAYDKGIYILTASQGFQTAKGNSKLGHGYLTFALIEEGLKSMVADRRPPDGQVFLREWLDYATERVPQIDRDESEKPENRTVQLERAKSRAAGKKDAEGPQKPRVFYRRESELRPLVVSRP